MTSPTPEHQWRRRKQRRLARLARFVQSYPLWYLAAIPVGIAIGLAGWVTDRPSMLQAGAWITVPGVMLLAWAVSMLAIAGVLNLFLLIERFILKRSGLVPLSANDQTAPTDSVANS